MLSIGSMAAGQGHYYTKLAREDYYLEGGEPPGYWRGRGAEALGLSGTVEDQALHNLFRGLSPAGNRSLVQRQKGKRRQPGVDLTFSAEKDVSVLWALGDKQLQEQIEGVHRRAVDAALSYLEAEAGWTRAGRGGGRVERAGLVVGCFEHGTSRAQDPNLHTHCLAINVGVGPDGKTRAIRSRDLYRHKMAAGALYRAEMAHLLNKELGLATRPTENGLYRLVGAPDDLREAFSKRREQIEAQLEAKGYATAAAAAVAANDTRQVKGHVSRHELKALWAQEARRLGYDAERLRAGLGRAFEHERGGELADLVAREATRLADTQAWYHERDLVRAVAERCQGGSVSAEQLRSEVRAHLASERAHDLGLNGQYHEYTSRDYLLRTERSLFAEADQLATGHWHNVDPEKLKAVKLRFGGVLSGEHQKAVDRLVGDASGLAMLSGLAGTGKTTTLRACAEAWRADGYRVVGAALAGKAARELEQGAGIQSETLCKREMQINPTLGRRMWHHAVQLYRAARKWDTRRLERLKLDRKSVLVIDEAGMLGAKDTQAMLHAANKAGAKVVLVGDEDQLPAIEGVSAFRALQQRHGAARLSNVVRQREGWMRDAVRAFAEGDSRTALSLLNKKGRLHLGGKGKEATMDRLVDLWAQHTPTAAQVRDTMILAGTRHDAERLNHKAQAKRRERGELGRFGVSLGGDPEDRSRQPERAHRNDRVMFRKNHRGLDVRNGEMGTVRRVDAPPLGRGRLWVELDDGRTVQVDLKRYDALSLGYAATTHKAQGATVEQAFVYTTPKDASREMSYVQVSRHRGDVHVFMPGHVRDEDFDELRKAMERSKQRDLAVQRSVPPTPGVADEHSRVLELERRP